MLLAAISPKSTVTDVNASSKISASNTKMGPPSLGPKKKSSIAPTQRQPLPVVPEYLSLRGEGSLGYQTARLALQKAARENGSGFNETFINSGTELAPRASNDTSGRTRSNLDALE